MRIDIRRGLSIATAIILILSAVSIALPIMTASAGTLGQLKVSSNRFSGNAVVQITVTDPDISDTTVSVGMPTVEADSATGGIVTVNMYQSTGGSWFGFIGVGPNRIDPQKPPQQDTSNIGAGEKTWVGGTLAEHVADTGAATTETITITYSDVDPPTDVKVDVVYDTTAGSVSLDRATIPPNGISRITVTDIDLNLDPTVKDHFTPEAIVNDTNTNSVYNAGIDKILVGWVNDTKALTAFPTYVKFWNSTADGKFTAGESIINDTDSDGYYISASTHFIPTDKVLLGPTPPNGTVLSVFYTYVMFYDADSNGKYNAFSGAGTWSVSLTKGGLPYPSAALPPSPTDLEETGPNTGAFFAKLTVPASATNGEIWTIKYEEASPSATRQASSTVTTTNGLIALDKGTYSISDRAKITLTEPDINLDTNTQESYTGGVSGTSPVSVESMKYPGLYIVKIKETGLNTGIFEGSFDFSFTTSSTGDIPVIRVAYDTDVFAYYSDAALGTGGAGTASASAKFVSHTGTISLDRTNYGPGQVGTITVNDPDMNTDPNVPENIGKSTVFVKSNNPAGADAETGVQMVETGANTGIFTGTFKTDTTLSVNTPGDTPTVAVRAGATITARYYDALTSGGATNVKTDATASYKSYTGSISLDQSSYHPGAKESPTEMPLDGEDMAITVSDPDLNTVSGAIDYTSLTGDGRVTLKVTRSGEPDPVPETVVQLKETGPNTGVFNGTKTLPSAVEGNDIITVTYYDAADESGVDTTAEESAIALWNTGILEVSSTLVPFKGYINVTVTDPDWNQKHNEVEKIKAGPIEQWGGVDYWSSTSAKSGGVQLTLDETGKNTGVFRAKVQVGVTDLPAAKVKIGDTLTFRYNDDRNAGGARVRITQTVKVIATTGEVTLDKSIYALNGKVTYTVTDPDRNDDPASVQSISAASGQLYVTTTTATDAISLKATETGPDTGIFEDYFILNSATGPAAEIGDGITVTYVDPKTATGAEDVAVTASATVNQFTGTVSFDKDSYAMSDQAIVTLSDPDLNSQPKVIEPQTVAVASTSDMAGIALTLIETAPNTGVFTGKVTFTADPSAGSMLKTKEGDTITTLYRDATPNPNDVPGYEPGTWPIPSLDRTATATIGLVLVIPADITSTTTKDSTGATKTSFTAGETVLPTATIKNKAAIDMEYLIAIQMIAPDGTVYPTNFVQTTLSAGQVFTFSPSFVLPSDAQTGTWSFEVNVFSTFPAQGGTAQASPVTGTFTVS